MAGRPNRITVFLSACFPTRTSLKRLFRKWTIAANATAIVTGKKMANAGVKTVPSPKPLRRLSAEADRAATQITKYVTEVTIQRPVDHLMAHRCQQPAGWAQHVLTVKSHFRVCAFGPRPAGLPSL